MKGEEAYYAFYMHMYGVLCEKKSFMSLFHTFNYNSKLFSMDNPSSLYSVYVAGKVFDYTILIVVGERLPTPMTAKKSVLFFTYFCTPLKPQ